MELRALGQKPNFRAIHEGEDVRFLRGIIEGPKLADFLQPSQTVEGIEITGVIGSELARLEIAPA